MMYNERPVNNEELYEALKTGNYTHADKGLEIEIKGVDLIWSLDSNSYCAYSTGGIYNPYTSPEEFEVELDDRTYKKVNKIINKRKQKEVK